MRDHENGASALVVSFIVFLLTLGLFAVGVLAIYQRALEPQSYAERGCPRAGPSYYECVNERLNSGPLAPGLWWFAAAGLVVVTCAAIIGWGVWNTTDRTLKPGDTENALDE